MTAAEIRTRLEHLDAERALAAAGACPAGDLMDLEEEIAATRVAYVAMAVTEIATLRAELFGAQVG